MPDEPPGEALGEEQRRGLRFRKREDHAIELFREARAHLSEIARLDRILLELGRFYNPVANAPIVDLAIRRRIIESVKAGRMEEAQRLLEERLALYAGTGDEDAGAAPHSAT